MRLDASPRSIALLTALLVPIAAGAQPPADGSVCDGLSGASWGLCKAYCEEMDCEGEDPNASSTACLNVLSRYEAHTDQVIPCARVKCPCFTPEDVDTFLLMCEDRGLGVACWDVIVMAQGPIYITEMNCNRESPIEIVRYLRAKIDARIGVHASCSRVNVTPLPNRLLGTTVEEAEACQQVLRDRIGDDVCDSVNPSP